MLWVASFGKQLLGKYLTGKQSQEMLKTVHNDNEERCNINPALIRKELCCCSHTGSIWGCSNGMHHVSSSPLPVYLSLTLPAFSGWHEWLLQYILWIKVTLWIRKTVFVLHVSQQSHCAHVQLLALSNHEIILRIKFHKIWYNGQQDWWALNTAVTSLGHRTFPSVDFLQLFSKLSRARLLIMEMLCQVLPFSDGKYKNKIKMRMKCKWN